MHLREIGKTSAFRMTLLFSALMIGSVMLLFGFVYWRSAASLTHQMDQMILHETQEFLDAADSRQIHNIDKLVADDPLHDWFAGLFSADHHVLAGNLADWPANAALDGRVEDIDGHALISSGKPLRHEMRVMSRSLPDGKVVVIAHRADEVHKVRDTILNALIAGLAGSVGLALVGGLVMSYASLRRIEAMHRATTGIMQGDLSRRLPVTGSGDDFDKLATIVNVMLNEIERLIADIKSAGDNIAHDLRTPLTRLRTRLEGALRRGGDIDTHRAAMEDAIADTDQILATFRALLRIGEVEAGQRRAGFGAVDMAKLVTSAAELFEPIASERGLTFTSSIEPASLRGDPDLLFEAVANLVDNAVKFTAQGGVHLSLTADGTITVVDSGPGLPIDIKEKMFQRFTRGDKARHMPGNGLGLSLVAAVTRLHGFTLVAENIEPGCRMRISPTG